MTSASANLADRILQRAKTAPDAIAFDLEDGTTVTYGTLSEASARYANMLKSAGVTKGDRVAVQAEKSLNLVFLYLGCLKLGAVYLPLNTAYTLSELEYFFTDAEPVLIVCAPDCADDVASLGRVEPTHILTMDAKGAGSVASNAENAPAEFTSVATELNDLAAILYTSGTTGRSKGAMLSHGNLMSNAETLIETWGISDSDVLVHALPIYHVHGLFVALNTMLLAGARMIFQTRFSPGDILSALPRATMMMGVPTFYTRLLADDGLSDANAGHMRLFISGSAPLLSETFASFKQRTGHAILERYGMTETGMNTSNPLDGNRKPGTVGPALPGVEARVVGGDGASVGVGDPGVLEVRGPNVFQGYWRMPEKTAEEFREDGFFITGDIANIDEDGYITIIGRNKDMIISGGLNVYPKEIEGVIDAFDGVGETAVIGVPHPDFGECVVAVVAGGDGSLDEQQIIERARETLAGFKVPKAVFFIEQLPRNTMGKVQKNTLREEHKGLYTAT